MKRREFISFVCGAVIVLPINFARHRHSGRLILVLSVDWINQLSQIS
jgi:hypothetical protein